MNNLPDSGFHSKGERAQLLQLQERRTRKGRRFRALFVIMIGGVICTIDASIINVNLPIIADYFGAPVAIAQWVPLIYRLIITSLLLFYGRLGDILGYKKIYLAGILCFIIASGVCALAPTIYWLIICRAIQGIGAGALMSVPYAIITAIFYPHERGQVIGINAISISAGLVLGPILGGLLISFWSWRLIFLINIPIGLVAFILALKFIPKLEGKQGSIDAAGAFSLFFFLFSFLLFVNLLQTSGMGLTALFILILAIITGIWFFCSEFSNSQPMINLSIFKNINFSLGTTAAFIYYISQYILIFLMPFYLGRVIHYPPDRIGLLMTVSPITTTVIAPLSGALSDRLGTRGLAAVGATICASALYAMSFLRGDADAFAIGWRLALFGLGTGIFQSPNNSAIMGSVPRSYLGVASGTLATSRNAGMALGIAAASMIIYVFVPNVVIVQEYLSGVNANTFLGGMKYSYLLGSILLVIVAILSILRGGAETKRFPAW